jgi:segregation and condensation protein B
MQEISPKHVIEAALLSAESPMSIATLRVLFEEELDRSAIQATLEELKIDWSKRGVHLTETVTGWRFQTSPVMATFLERLNPERPARYSRAVMETLAIIAYRQPVTRGDIEDIRGVSVSSQVVKSLEDRVWIEVIGHKDVLGRPALFGTTRKFLDDLGLSSIGELPELLNTAGSAEMGDAIEQQVIEFPMDGSALPPVSPAPTDVLSAQPYASTPTVPNVGTEDIKTQDLIHESERIERSEPSA